MEIYLCTHDICTGKYKHWGGAGKDGEHGKAMVLIVRRWSQQSLGVQLVSMIP